MRRRIIALAAGTALLAVILLSIPLGVLAGQGYLRDERLQLQRAAAIAAASVRGDISAAVPRVDSTEIDVAVYNSAGRRVSGTGPATAPTTVRAALAGRAAGTTTEQAMTVTAPVSDGDRVVAALLLSTSLDAVHHRTAQAWLLLAAMDLAAVVIAAAAAVMVTRRLAGPLDRLTAVADRVGRGDLAAHAPRSGIAEVDTLAATLNTTVERVRGMIGRERAFSAEVSHQLRTPLSGLRLELEASVAEHDSARLRRALAGIDRLETTIGDVIALARDLPTAQHVAVGALLAGVEDRWRGPLAAAGRPLRLGTTPDSPAELRLSPAAATQILDVLLDNACRHGRGAVSVCVRSLADGLASVDVSDDGPAFQREAWQLFGVRDQQNPHGLGLPYARRLAEAEGARLTLRLIDPPTFTLTTRAEIAADS